MTEAEWLAASDPQSLLDSCQRFGSDRKLRLFACACCRRFRSITRGKANLRVLEATEAFADGMIRQRDLELARGEWFTFDSVFPISDTWRAALSSATITHSRVWATDTARCAAAATTRPLREQHQQIALLRCIFGNPFRPVTFSPSWRSETAVSLAAGIHEQRAFDRLPILADALEEAGCDHSDVLSHCRGPGPHARGCWVVDGVLGKE